MASFIPDGQEAKLALIRQAAEALDPTLSQAVRPAPADEDNVIALKRQADALMQAAGENGGPGADAAKRLAADMLRLADANPAMRTRAELIFASPLNTSLEALRNLLQAEPITEKNIPLAFAGDWIKPDGRARVQVYPKGDPDDNEVLRQFARAVLAVEPEGTTCWPAPESTVNMNTKRMGRLGLSEAEEDAIVGFLQTMSDGFMPVNRQ